MEIVHTSKIKQNHQRVAKLRPLLIGMMVVTALTVIPTAIWAVISDRRAAYNAHSIVVGLFVLILAVGSSVYGIAILKKIPARGFLVKITRFLLMFDMFAFLLIAVLIVYTIIPITPWSFLIGTSLVRVGEFGLISAAILLLQTKRNANKQAPSVDSDHTANNQKGEITKVSEVGLTQTMTEESVMGDSALEYTPSSVEAGHSCQSNRE